MKKLIYKQYCNSNTQKLQVLMKLESCIILKLFLNFSHSEPENCLVNFILIHSYIHEHSYNLYWYKKVCIGFL